MPLPRPLPAETESEIPSATILLTAASIPASLPPFEPMLMFATAGWPAWWWPTVQSMPATMPALEPLPPQSRTRTAMMWTPLATPTSEPPIVPDVCVPCPWQSSAGRLPSTASYP